MAFLEDPRLRQRWNEITQNAETVTENAAAGIWSFQHNYINPCLAWSANSIDQCTAVCLGDREERARRQRERERARGHAEFSFDFYDDWYENDESGGLLGGWSNEDWDRLLAGTGSQRRHGGEIAEQPKRKRGMSYGTRGVRRKPPAESDPTVIPSTQPIGFLGRLPWKIGGTLRYRPSAEDLQDHPGGRHEYMGETEPLLGGEDESGPFFTEPRPAQSRKRSGTSASGETSDSYRSRGDLFPSDGEGDEDAVPLDDEFTAALDKADDRSSNKTRSSKGKRRADSRGMSRTVSRTTIASGISGQSSARRRSSESGPQTPDITSIPSIEDLREEEERARREEDGVVERRRIAANQLALERGLAEANNELKEEMSESEGPAPEGKVDTAETAAIFEHKDVPSANAIRGDSGSDKGKMGMDDEVRKADIDVPPSETGQTNSTFVPARLPSFG